MSQPRAWTLEELAHDAEAATAIFRRERLDEPLARYSQFFDTFKPVFRNLIDQLPRFADAPSATAAAYRGTLDQPPRTAANATDAIADLVRDSDMRTAFRYLAAPPISEDDLKTLAKTTLSPEALRRNPEQACRVREIVFHIVDPHRFPWIVGNRSPTKHERDCAIVASAALVATRKVETLRRSAGAREQSNAVKSKLLAADFSEQPPRPVHSLDSAPPPGAFCGECLFGSSRADIVARLPDGRILVVECKASNSAVNSVKRINREAAGKAAAWLREFGQRHIVPAAVIGGVFRPENLEAAQDVGLALFWQHRLEDLSEFIQAVRA